MDDFGRPPVPPIKEEFIDHINNVVCEIAYRDADGVIVGYWAYGFWQKGYPVQSLRDMYRINQGTSKK